jgi:hypothetical protein
MLWRWWLEEILCDHQRIGMVSDRTAFRARHSSGEDRGRGGHEVCELGVSATPADQCLANIHGHSVGSWRPPIREGTLRFQIPLKFTERGVDLSE